jgi:hypothetical protein
MQTSLSHSGFRKTAIATGVSIAVSSSFFLTNAHAGLFDLVKSVGDKIEDGINKIEDKVEDVVGLTKDQVENVTDKVKEEVHRIEDQVKEGTADAKESIKDVFDKVDEEVARVKDNAKQGLGDLATGVKKIGDLDNKLEDGIWQLMGVAFDQVLKSHSVTNLMFKLAMKDKSGALIDMMIKSIKENPELSGLMADQMVNNPNFTPMFVQMALGNQKLSVFFFDFVNQELFDALTYSMVVSREVTVGVAKLISQKRDADQELYGKEAGHTHAYYEFLPGRPFYNLMFNMGSVEDTNDGSEFSNERMYFALFSYTESANAFLVSLFDFDADIRKQFLDLVFLGKMPLAEGETEAVIHRDTSFYNIYVIMAAMLRNQELPQTNYVQENGFESDSPWKDDRGMLRQAAAGIDANGVSLGSVDADIISVFSQFMPLMLKEDMWEVVTTLSFNPMNDYGVRFLEGVSVLASSEYKTHVDNLVARLSGVIEDGSFMGSLLEAMGDFYGFVALTDEEIGGQTGKDLMTSTLVGLIQDAVDAVAVEDAPLPHDFIGHTALSNPEATLEKAIFAAVEEGETTSGDAQTQEDLVATDEAGVSFPPFDSFDGFVKYVKDGVTEQTNAGAAYVLESALNNITDARLYLDSDETWLDVPDWMRSSVMYVVEAGDESYDEATAYLTVKLNMAKDHVLILIFDEEDEVPAWVEAQGFVAMTDNSSEMSTSTGRKMKLYALSVPAGTEAVVLNGKGDADRHQYSVAVMEESANPNYSRAKDLVDAAEGMDIDVHEAATAVSATDAAGFSAYLNDNVDGAEITEDVNGNIIVIAEGQIDIETEGNYTFAVASPGAIEILVDGTVVASRYVGGSASSVAIELDEGDHDFDIRQAYNADTDAEGFSLTLQVEGGEAQPVTDEMLSGTPWWDIDFDFELLSFDELIAEGKASVKAVVTDGVNSGAASVLETVIAEAEGAQAYLDDDETWVDLPEWLRDATMYVDESTQNVQDEAINYLTLSLDQARDHVLFLLFDEDEEVPAWVAASGFVEVNDSPKTSNGKMKAFAKVVEKGSDEIVLEEGDYIVAAKSEGNQGFTQAITVAETETTTEDTNENSNFTPQAITVAETETTTEDTNENSNFTPSDSAEKDDDNGIFGGCTVSTTGTTDPMLPLLALSSLVFLMRRKKTQENI